MVLQNTIVEGDMLKISRSNLEVQREACVTTMAQYKVEKDADMYLFAMGHLAAINDLLSAFER